jgi:hypothetical protein
MNVIGSLRIASAMAAALLCAAANASVLFSDDFDGDTPGLNAVPPGWTVTGGTVDIIGSGPHGNLFDLVPGHGYYVDLDGSTNSSGLMSHGPLALNAGTPYHLTFLLAGSQRGDTNSVLYGIDFNGDGVVDLFNSAIVPSAQPFTSFDMGFLAPTTSSARIIFRNSGGDNLGALLDNVSLTSVVPEPEPFALLATGLGLLGWIARCRTPKRNTE